MCSRRCRCRCPPLPFRTASVSHTCGCSWSYEVTRCCVPGVRSESGGWVASQLAAGGCGSEGQRHNLTMFGAAQDPTMQPGVQAIGQPLRPTTAFSEKPPPLPPAVPFSEMLSAELLPAVTGMWRLPGTRLHRMVIWTFRRSPQNPASWHPRQVRPAGAALDLHAGRPAYSCRMRATACAHLANCSGLPACSALACLPAADLGDSIGGNTASLAAAHQCSD